jgi:hypothetical protein
MEAFFDLEEAASYGFDAAGRCAIGVGMIGLLRNGRMFWPWDHASKALRISVCMSRIVFEALGVRV